MLKVSEREFKRLTLKRILRALEWVFDENERQLEHTRLICYFSGNHSAKSPQDLWMTRREQAKKQRDIIEGRVPFAKFRKLSKEEIESWPITKN